MHRTPGRDRSGPFSSSFTGIVACVVLPLTLVGCLKGPPPATEAGVTLHLMLDRDVAEVLLAHCEGAIALATAIESSAASPDVKSVAAVVRAAEQRDLDTIILWIKNQSNALSNPGQAHAREIRTAHSRIAEEFTTRTQPELDDSARRMLVGHYTEEVNEIRRTPARDKALRQIADGMRRRMSDEIRKLSRPSSGYI